MMRTHNVSDALQALLETLAAQTPAPGMVLALQHGDSTFSSAWGYADLENDLPMTAQSVHNIGSISKVITAVAVMQLSEQGALALDEDIRHYLPWFPDKGYRITLRQLMTHTSGIRHYLEGEFGEDDVLARQHFSDYERSTRRWRDDPLCFAPGSCWHYSSYGSGLLQGVIEAASGLPFEDYLRRHIWQPAGMHATQFDNPYRIIKRRARGYASAPDGSLINAPFVDLSNRYASGGMVSSAEDMLRFGHALHGATLLKPESLRAMFAPQIDDSLPDWDSSEARSWTPALLWELYDTPLGLAPGHQGSVRGTNQCLLIVPGQLTLYYHANHDEVDATAIMMQATALLAQQTSPAGGSL
jgi:CubicO group peptidase (beta-lactamase class C family)